MRKSFVSTFLFPILLTLTVQVSSQTRPRRVEQPTNASAVSSNEARAQERPRATRERAPTVREGVPRESRWPDLLLRTGISIGAGLGRHGSSCGPSRGTIMSGPR